MAPVLQRLTQATFRQHRLMLLSWLVVIVLVVGVYVAMGSQLNNQFTICRPSSVSPATGSSRSRSLASPAENSRALLR
jgi:hypothetical protein